MVSFMMKPPFRMHHPDRQVCSDGLLPWRVSRLVRSFTLFTLFIGTDIFYSEGKVTSGIILVVALKHLFPFWGGSGL